MSKKPRKPRGATASGIGANADRSKLLAELARKLEMVTQAYVRSEREKKTA